MLSAGFGRAGVRRLAKDAGERTVNLAVKKIATGANCGLGRIKKAR